MYELKIASQFSESPDVYDLYFLLPLELHEVRRSGFFFFFFRNWIVAFFTTCCKIINGLNTFLSK